MKSNTSEAISRYGDACYILATYPGNIRARLIEVGSKIVGISIDNFPEDIKNEIKWIDSQFLKKDTIRDSIKGRHVMLLLEMENPLF